jgi:hypothetical protein
VIQIGEVDGADHYELHNAVSAVRLSGGTIVVLNAGSQQLRFFNTRGEFLRSTGARGAGPGEFRRPERIHVTQADTLSVYDSGLGRESWFDPSGTFVRTVPLAPGPPSWKRDVWLYRNNFVDGPATPEGRAAMRAVLDKLPTARPARTLRYVKVDDQSRLWVSEQLPGSAHAMAWTVYRHNGALLASVTTPPRFEPQHIGADFVLGRARDELDVEYIRLYSLNGASVASVDARPSANAAKPEKVVPIGDEMRKRIESALRNLQMQEELFYSKPANSYRYTDRTDLLEWPEDLKGLVVHITHADDKGYTAIIFHETEPIACGLAVGGVVPVGWTAGVVVCG